MVMLMLMVKMRTEELPSNDHLHNEGGGCCGERAPLRTRVVMRRDWYVISKVGKWALVPIIGRFLNHNRKMHTILANWLSWFWGQKHTYRRRWAQKKLKEKGLTSISNSFWHDNSSLINDTAVKEWEFQLICVMPSFSLRERPSNGINHLEVHVFNCKALYVFRGWDIF